MMIWVVASIALVGLVAYGWAFNLQGQVDEPKKRLEELGK